MERKDDKITNNLLFDRRQSSDHLNQAQFAMIPNFQDGSKMANSIPFGNNVNNAMYNNIMMNSQNVSSSYIFQQKKVVNDELNQPQSKNIKKHSRKAFSPEEDALIANLVKIHGTQKWDVVSSYLKGRNARQCRERWKSSLSPGLTNGPWTQEEDKLLIKLHSELGPKWSQIAKHFKGRSDYNVKNRWQRFKRYGDLYDLSGATERETSSNDSNVNNIGQKEVFSNEYNNSSELDTNSFTSFDDDFHFDISNEYPCFHGGSALWDNRFIEY